MRPQWARGPDTWQPPSGRSARWPTSLLKPATKPISRQELYEALVELGLLPLAPGQPLKDDPDTARIPVLVVTAKQITAADRAILTGNVMAILNKTDFDRDRFTAEVRRAMASRRAAV